MVKPRDCSTHLLRGIGGLVCMVGNTGQFELSKEQRTAPSRNGRWLRSRKITSRFRYDNRYADDRESQQSDKYEQGNDAAYDSPGRNDHHACSGKCRGRFLTSVSVLHTDRHVDVVRENQCNEENSAERQTVIHS